MKTIAGWLLMAILATVVVAGCSGGKTEDAATKAEAGADGAKKGGADAVQAKE